MQNDKLRRDDLRRKRERWTQGRDISELMHDVEQPDRRAACRDSYRAFIETYFPESYWLGFSRDHEKAIGRIEEAVLHGGLFALAMPRGSGKTTLCEHACLWALLYGHHRFVALIGASAVAAKEMLGSIKTELDSNDLIDEDFPEATVPIRALEGIAQRAGGQLLAGKPTRLEWKQAEIRFPDVPGSASAGSVIRVAGITGRVRGMKSKTADGTPIRPSLVIVDDPQDDRSAWSMRQCEKRESILAGAILGLAGPGQKIAGVMPCTVIRKGDMADRILDRQEHPEWRGERTKMIYQFPKNNKLWERYGEILIEDLNADKDLSRATEYYRQNRAAMDEGAVVAWEARYNPDEISALQHAMGLKIRDEAAFWAEYQNEPMGESYDPQNITIDDVFAKCSKRKRGTVAPAVETLTAFIDVQGDVLYWLVAGWEKQFTGHVIDYGTYPDQGMRYFTLHDIKVKLSKQHPGTGREGAWYAGFDAACRLILNREWIRDDGAAMRVSRVLIDANDGNAMHTIFRFCSQCDWPSVVMPSRGRGVGASNKPFAEYRNEPGDRSGLNWRIPKPEGRKIRYFLYDTNFWKSFARARLKTPLGDAGSLYVFGRSDTDTHRMLGEQFASEYSVRTEGRGRAVDEWKLRPGRDNHWWDCLVGAAAAASEQGINPPGKHNQIQEVKRKRKKIKVSQIGKRRR